MRRSFLIILAILFIAGSASADNFKIGVQGDVGIPDGSALGLTIRPKFNWLRLNGSITYNGIAPGLRAGVTVDPVRFGIAPTFTVEGGWESSGTVPFIQNAPNFGYTYLDLHLGMEVGHPDSWRIFLHAGPTWINGTASNVTPWLNQDRKTITADNLSVTGIIIPTATLGFVKYF